MVLSGPFRKFSTRVLQNALINTMWHAMVECDCGHIHIAFLKKLRPLFLYLIYELVQLNRNYVSLFKQVKE